MPVKRKAHDDTTDLESTENIGMHNGACNSSSDDVLGGKVDHGDVGVRPVGGDGEGRPAVGVQCTRATILSDSTVKRERFGDLSGWVKAGCAGNANKGKFMK